MNVRTLFGVDVFGVDVDPNTRCAHYRSDSDVVAIQFPCCKAFYGCIDCHRDLAGHAAERWHFTEFQREAILCGVCGHKLRIQEYLDCGSRCPRCAAPFNPGCALHYDLYFEFPPEPC